MKLLVDASAGRRLAELLRAAGHDVVFSRDLGPDPGDAGVIKIAAAAQRVVITVDQNFARSVIFGETPNIGIVFIPDLLVGWRLQLVSRAIEAHEANLISGCWVVAMPGRMRLRKPT